MAESYEFYSSVAGDTRSYTFNTDLAAFFRLMVTDGVIVIKPSTALTWRNLEVVEYAALGKHTVVYPGYAWVYGNYSQEVTVSILTHDANTTLNTRYDLIVLHNDLTTGIAPAVIKGTMDGEFPAYTAYDLVLGYVALAKNYTDIHQADIQAAGRADNKPVP